MARHLTDKEKKKVVAEYVSCGNYSAVARKFGLSISGTKKIILSDPESVKKSKEKKEQNTLDMIEYLDSKKNEAQTVVSKILKNISNDKLLKAASLKEQATVMAIVIDKFIIPYTNRINKVDEENYTENRETLKEQIAAALREQKND